ncbi:uncharacterized protein SCHCODRAFT_02319632 [Schizophyllum commune H4-8]|uniref:uncharacterized protein n=1 Tax=Schizophyllum commune (strain H4-8 / FGSC 9210) TaxID=578458 RepID=UPI00215F0988|nr:uncharacterized protein SCHCODRAFT_02319632 [Schizophyllum commune H4-8]KAI5891438.1 hypothetical protein SCHCODRAFT_02319632 [Schizophyllum commune H4-8]
MLGIMRAFFMPRADPQDVSLEEGRASREKGRLNMEKGRPDLSWACRGEDASTIGRGSTTIRSEGPHAASLSPPALLRKTSLAASQRQEHAEERAVARKPPSRNAWLHTRPRADKGRSDAPNCRGSDAPSHERNRESSDAPNRDKPRLGASLTKLRRSSSLTKLGRSSSLNKLRRTASLDRPQRSGSVNLPPRRAPLRVNTITISRPQPLQPGTTGSLTGIDLPSPTLGPQHATVRRAASLPARLPAGPPPSAFRAPERVVTPTEERFAARFEAGVPTAKFDMEAVVKYQEGAGGIFPSSGGSFGSSTGNLGGSGGSLGGSGGSFGGAGEAVGAPGRLRVRMPEAAAVRPMVARPPMLSAIEEGSYKSPAPSLRVLPGSAAMSMRTTTRTMTSGSPIERVSREALSGFGPMTNSRKVPRLLVTPSSPARSPVERDFGTMHEAWGADIQEQHGPNADSFYDDTLASPHADSFVTAGSDRNRQSSLASILGIDTNHSPTSAVTIRSLPFRQHDYEHEPSPLALNPADTLEEEKASHDTAAIDEETMRRIEHRWDKVGADLPYVLTVPRPPTARAHRRRWTPAQVLFFLGFLLPAFWLIGGWLFTMRGEIPAYRCAPREGAKRGSGGSVFSCIRERGKKQQPKELVLPRWRERADSPGLSMPAGEKETRKTGAQLDVICRYPYVERRVVADILTPSGAGVDAITVSARPEWTRRVIDPWIIRCRLALWYFSVLVFFGSALAIVVMIVTTHFL